MCLQKIGTNKTDLNRFKEIVNSVKELVFGVKKVPLDKGKKKKRTYKRKTKKKVR